MASPQLDALASVLWGDEEAARRIVALLGRSSRSALRYGLLRLLALLNEEETEETEEGGPAMADESQSAAAACGDPLVGPLYHAVVEAESMLHGFAFGINSADGADPQACAALREAWDGIMERMGRVEQLLAALPMPEREADGGA